MNREGNVYTILYASIMIIVIAFGLSLINQTLRPRQIRNENIDTMRQILRSLNIEASASEAEAKYEELIINAYLITPDGTIIAGTEGAQYRDAAFSSLGRAVADRLPVFEANVNGNTVYILPMRGSGMWGPIWGYLAVNADGNTIFGATFDHESETPGLGDAIAEQWFGRQYIGKRLFQNSTFTSVTVVRPGTSSLRGEDYVDGISGGTITSRSVGTMMYQSIGAYRNFLMNLKSNR